MGANVLKGVRHFKPSNLLTFSTQWNINPL